MNQKIVCALSILIILGLFGCTSEDQRLRPALESITAQDLANNTEILASDEFEGRAPASNGEMKTVDFLEQEFRKIGLKPGNGQSFLQEIPMVVITGAPTGQLEIKGGKKPLTLAYKNEFVAQTQRVVEETQLADSEVVFAGYGIVAPEYNWNDYDGLDVRGKTVVVLVNDPGCATQDPALFSGRTMTYYGRWTYKYEEAARQRAAGVFIVRMEAFDQKGKTVGSFNHLLTVIP
jgi:hypothetical protein